MQHIRLDVPFLVIFGFSVPMRRNPNLGALFEYLALAAVVLAV